MKYALLLARQRSGTGALASVLSKHPELAYIGEVLHPDNIGQPQNFFTFLKAHLGRHPDDFTPGKRHALFMAFLEEEAAKVPGRRLVVDVKYRSLHQLNGDWRGLVERPTLLHRAIVERVPILHLTRRNMLHSFVSGRRAEDTGVWHATDPAEVTQSWSTVIDIRKLSQYMAKTAREVEMITDWTGPYRNKEVFDYDEMFDAEGQIEAGLSARIAKRLGVSEFTDRQPEHLRQGARPLRDEVENYPVIRAMLAGSEFAWMLD